MRNFLKSAALIGLALGALVAEAKADVVFTFVELSATVDGIPTNAGAVGEVVLTDAGFASGSVSVRTNNADIPFIYFLNGVVSMFFGTPGLGGLYLAPKQDMTPS